jgi:WD40 repeat protein
MRLWNVTTGEELRRFEGHSDWVTSVAFSPDGHQALSGSDTVRLWDVATGEELHRFSEARQVNSVAFSSNGRRVLAGGRDRAVRLWDVASGRLLGSVCHQNWVYCVAFSPDGQFAISGGGGIREGDQIVPGSDFAIRLWALPAAD